jgi:DHA1 family tetracycline resistance protein-like MFS transporter
LSNPPNIKATRQRTVTVAFITILVDMMGFGIAFPESEYFPNLSVRSLGIWYGALQSSFALAQFFGAPILGALSDRFGRKPIAIFCLIGASLGFLIFAYGVYHANLLYMFLGRIIPGFAGGNIAIMYSSMADLSGGKEKVRDFGLAGSAFGLGMILGPVIGGILSQPGYLPVSGFHVPFLFMAILSLLNALLVLVVFRETNPKLNFSKIRPWSGFQNLMEAFAYKRLAKVFATVLIHMSGFSLFIQFIHFFLMEEHGFEQVQIGYVFGYVGLWTILTQGFLVRPLANFLKPSRIVANVIIFYAIAVALLLYPTKSFWIYIILPFATVFQGLYMPNMTAVISNISDRDIQGKMLGINQSLNAFSNAIPPLIGGYLLSYGVRWPLYIALFCHLIAWVIFNWFYRGEEVKP